MHATQGWEQPGWEQPGFGGMGAQQEQAGTVEERLSRLESMVAQPHPQIFTLKRCAIFRGQAPSVGPNPRTENGFTLRVFQYNGAPAPNTRIVAWGAFSGLDCGFATQATLPATTNQVEVTLVHFARPASVVAYNVFQMPVAQATMSGPQQVGETLTLSGTGIRRLVITAPQNETLLLSVCLPGKLLKEKRETKELKDKEKDKDKDKELKEEKEFKEKDKEWKEKDKDLIEGGPGMSGQPLSVEERLSQLEAAVSPMSHFISPEDRPDLSGGALSQEPDLTGRESS